MEDDPNQGKWTPIFVWAVVAAVFAVLLYALIAGNLGRV